MYVCICAAVSQAEARECIVHGEARSIEDIVNRCGAGGGCGSCHDRLADLLSKHSPTGAHATSAMSR
ncbi:(2Fe-2S)-binding protein [Nocardiaceae bacterium YC2-7]|uniref:(2Fe-2S)-binding protein n=2 Tax=Antrihabitans stalactiti TaxID=2584121 RepID=A0A848KF83_9NOCA|nr:(2Fe-2S)-binding protein [Antrihabitans stalactiti]